MTNNDAERVSDIDVDKPLVWLSPDNGIPTWQQVNDLFERYGMASPDWRMRDELVCWLLWARYGEKAADIIEAQSKALAEAREECASIAQDCPGIVRSEHSNVDPFWQGVAAAKVAIMQAIRALTPTPENPNG